MENIMSEKDVDRLEKKVDKLIYIISGNGEPGLAEETRRNSEAIASHVKECAGRKEKKHDNFRIFVGIMQVLIAGLLLALLKGLLNL
jgi:hypothetical protein